VRALPGILCLVVAGCTSARPVEGTRAPQFTWKGEIEAQLAARCASCHDATTAAGGYRVDSYLAAIGGNTPSGAIAVAGDASSPLLTVLDPAQAQPPHAGQSALYAMLVTWVVTDDLAYELSNVHGGGIQNPASPDFHGNVLANDGWNFPLCQTCHGNDFSGGITGVSCLSCHVNKPTSCDTCHGASPTTGAHALHVLGGPLLGRKVDCSECHIKPATWDAPGHIRNADGTAITTPVPVIFGALAQTPTPTRLAAATYQNGRCENVYCHGGATPDTNASAQSPAWSDTAPATCTSCHGQPPAGHPVGTCATCHSAIIDASGHLLDSTTHVSGKLTLGDGDGTCLACHTILDGAHTSHLQGTHKLAAPIACNECHFVPTQVDSPSHFTDDGLAIVFPLGDPGPLAHADSAIPIYAAPAMQCSGTYCHGSGALLSKDTSVEIIRDPIWTPGSGAGRCGTCHGLPPLDGVHDPHWQITQCATCHPKSVDAYGAIIFTNGQSTHLNGVVDAP
jgi:predicted CxxxxCH...CXXCH cytochrome family protein